MLRRLKKYIDLFKLMPATSLILMRASEVVIRWSNAAWVREGRCLQRFFQTVPVSDVENFPGGYRFSTTLGNRECEVFLRKHSSDMDVFLQVVHDRIYQEAIRRLSARVGPLRIIDAGANVGITTLLLASIFPEAEVLAIEPEAENYEALRRHCEANHLEQVRTFQGGLWVEDTLLSPNRNFRDGRAWSFSLKSDVHEKTDSLIKVKSLSSLLSDNDWERIDFLKVDIEGAEAELIRNRDFLETVAQKVSLLSLEVHPEIVSIDEVREAFDSVGLNSYFDGENLVVLGRDA